MEQRADLHPALSSLVERQRALRSAWSVLAPSGLSTEKTDIAEIGRTLTDELMELVDHDGPSPNFEAMVEIEARIDSLEGEMREIAFKIPVSQFRSTLPDCISHNRRGVLDLLDLTLGAELLGLDGTQARIPLIDYLITLLCGTGSDQSLQDPVQLTPRLHELCERSGIHYSPHLPEIEAEFFHAADMYEADAREEVQLRALRDRKAELGSDYFSPQVLRAIVAYNAALLRRIDDEILASRDWGSLPPVAAEAQPAASVFDTPLLPLIAQALRRRQAGETPELNTIDRIAWCLDLEYPTANERRALRAEPASPANDLTGTVILVGLLCRSSAVLEDELTSIGITPKQLFEVWVPEVSEALQQQVNLGISGDHYREACKLSELTTRYLYASMAELRRKNRSRTPTPGTLPPSPATTEATQSIVEEALVNAQIGEGKDERPVWKLWPLRTLAAIGVAIVAVLLAFGVGRALFWNSDHSRLNRDQLDQVSPFLAHGIRDANGQGLAFVGSIRDGWFALEASDRMLVAADLVGALRDKGVRDIMIYDDDGFLRIQALGEQTPRLLPAPQPER